MEKINNIEIGEKIRKLRTAAGHTQDDLSELLGVKRQVISYYESGTRTPNLSHLMAIAKEYHTTTDYLLGLSAAATDNKDVQSSSDYTGLSENNVKLLHSYCSGCNMERYFVEFVNDVIAKFSHIDFNICNFIYYKARIEKNKPDISYNQYFEHREDLFSDEAIAEGLEGIIFTRDDVISEDLENAIKEYQVLKYHIFTAFNECLNTNADEIINEYKNLLFTW